MVGGSGVIVRFQRRRRICELVGAENLAARDVRKQQSAWQDVIVAHGRTVVGVLNGPGPFAVGEWIYGGGQLQTGRSADQTLDGLRIARRRPEDVFVQVATQHVRLQTVGCEIDGGE